MTQETDIAIIGAGAAGIAAARRLAKSGLSSILLEALPRAGGRAWTRQAGGLTLDLGCGWLHSAERNPWSTIAEDRGFHLNRATAAWGQQYRDLGISAADLAAARAAFEAWNDRLAETPPDSDCAADALEPGSRWTPYLQALSGYISGDELERISARDYAAYDAASTWLNWRVPAGYGTLIATSLPDRADLRLSTPVEALRLDGRRVELATPAGTLRCRAAIITVSTSVLGRSSIRWPAALDAWREAATRLPLGRNEKLFLEISGDNPFEAETHVLGSLDAAATGTYYIRPFGWPVIECFLGGSGARVASAEGHGVAYQRAIDQLAQLFGNAVRKCLSPLIASDWAGTPSIGGAYSHALPGQADARRQLAQPFDDRIFFAGEATHATDFSTAHGAYESGLRAAEEAITALSDG